MATSVSADPRAEHRRSEVDGRRSASGADRWTAWPAWVEYLVAAGTAGVLFLLGFGGGATRLATPLGGGDLLPAYATARMWAQGAPFGNSSFGFPFGMELRDYPTADVLLNAVPGGLTWATGNPFLGMNLVFALSFPVTALAAVWVFRIAGLRGPLMVVAALALTFVPYHWYRIVHIHLGTMFSAVLGVGLALLVGNGTVERRLRSGATRRAPFVATLLLVSAAIAASGIYYACFTVLICAAAWLHRVARGAGWRELLRAAAPVAAVGVLLGAVLAPSVLYQAGHPPIEPVAARAVVDSVIFSGALVFTLLPAPISRIPGFGPVNRLVEGAADEGKDWIWTGVIPSQTHSMPRWYSDFGSVSTTVAVLVLVAGAFVLARRTARSAAGGAADGGQAPGAPERQAGSLGLVTLLLVTTLLFFVPWGLNYLFSAFVSPQLRGWDRLLPVFFTLVLIGAGLVLQRLRIRRPRGATLVVAGVALGVVVLDSVLPFRSVFAAASAAGGRFSGAGYTYAAALNEAVPGRCGVLELPYIGYPEEPPKVGMTGYEQLWPALTNPAKEWSSGAMKGTLAGAWQKALGDDVDAADVPALQAGGFCAVHVDRRGYAEEDADRVTGELTDLLGGPVATGLEGNWLAYRLPAPAGPLPATERLPEEPGGVGTFYAPPRITPGQGAPGSPVAETAGSVWQLAGGSAGFDVRSLDAGPAFASLTGSLRAGACAVPEVRVTLSSRDERATRSFRLAPGQEATFTLELRAPVRAAQVDVSTIGAACPPDVDGGPVVALVDPRAGA